MLVIATYNERTNVAALISRIRQAAGDEPIFFVDDNSPDGTAAEIRRIQQHDGQIHLMVRPGKAGYGSACREGIQKVLRENLADYLIQFDADLSHPPELLPRMIELLQTHPVVIGSRYVPGGGSQNWNIRRRTLSFGANLYARLLTGVPVQDMTAGFMGFQADTLRKINLDEIHSDGYAFTMEIKFNLHQRDVEFHEFPIVFVEREAGKSKFNPQIMWEGVKFPWKALLRRITGGGLYSQEPR